jgi:hemin uptake protein HemP
MTDPRSPTPWTAADARTPAAFPAAWPASTPTIASTDLLRGQRLVLIEHHGLVYQLRATSQGKLILTK